MSSKTKFALTAKFRNGNSTTGTNDMLKINFKTAYGLLSIPVSDLTTVRFGLIVSNEVKQKVDALVDVMRTSKESDQKRAFQSLVESSAKAIPVLEKYIESDGPDEGSYSISEAIATLKTKHEIADDYLTEDIITINGDYNFPGEAEIDTIGVSTEYGALTIPRDKLVSIHIEIEEEGTALNKKFTLEAGKHIPVNPDGGWLKTGIKIKKNQKLTIESKGEVVLASLSNQPHKPDGSYLPPGTAWTPGNNDPNQAPIFGNVVYRIGEGQQSFKAGAKIETQAYQSGMLYLSIFETVYNAQNSGEYQVTVKVS